MSLVSIAYKEKIEELVPSTDDNNRLTVDVDKNGVLWLEIDLYTKSNKNNQKKRININDNYRGGIVNIVKFDYVVFKNPRVRDKIIEFVLGLRISGAKYILINDLEVDSWVLQMECDELFISGHISQKTYFHIEEHRKSESYKIGLLNWVQPDIGSLKDKEKKFIFNTIIGRQVTIDISGDTYIETKNLYLKNCSLKCNLGYKKPQILVSEILFLEGIEREYYSDFWENSCYFKLNTKEFVDFIAKYNEINFINIDFLNDNLVNTSFEKEIDVLGFLYNVEISLISKMRYDKACILNSARQYYELVKSKDFWNKKPFLFLN